LTKRPQKKAASFLFISGLFFIYKWMWSAGSGLTIAC
jgi:hypothetical protein